MREIEDQYAEGIGAERFDALVSSLEAVLDVQSRSDEQRCGLSSDGSRVPTSRPSGPTEPRPNVAASTAARSRARALGRVAPRRDRTPPVVHVAELQPRVALSGYGRNDSLNCRMRGASAGAPLQALRGRRRSRGCSRDRRVVPRALREEDQAGRASSALVDCLHGSRTPFAEAAAGSTSPARRL